MKEGENLWMEGKEQARTWVRVWKNQWVAEVSSIDSCLWDFFILVVMGELSVAFLKHWQVSPLKSKSNGQQESCRRRSPIYCDHQEACGQIILAESTCRSIWQNPSWRKWQSPQFLWKSVTFTPRKKENHVLNIENKLSCKIKNKRKNQHICHYLGK